MNNYGQFIGYLFGEKRALIFDVIIIVFLFSGLSVMLVAGGSLFLQTLGRPIWHGFAVTFLAVYVTLLAGTEGILWFNTVLMPGLLVICTATAAFGIIYADTAWTDPGSYYFLLGDNWFIASIQYVAYNFVLGAVILTSLGGRPKNACMAGAVTGGLILGLLATVTCQALLLQGEKIASQEIPMLALAGQLHPWAGRLYSLALWGAIMTTALGNGFGLLRRLESYLRWPRPLLALAVLIPTLPFVGWPLARAVGTLYPLLGYVGVPFIIAIILKMRLPARRI